MEIRFRLNGHDRTVETPPGRRVVDLLREDLGLTGVKEGCGSGECGACTILVEGEPRLACLMVAAQLQGRTVRTVEGLAGQAGRHPLQEAFVRKGAVQCGFCTPGMLLAAEALLARHPDPGRAEIREGLSGNLCRCTGYQKIVDAVEEAALLLRTGGQPGVEKGEPGEALPGTQSAAGRPLASPGGQPSAPAVVLPETLPRLFSILASEPQARLFAGGTDLFVQLQREQERPSLLVGLERIAALRGIRAEAGGLRIGATARHGELIADPHLATRLPLLARALATLGSPPIRGMGTLGGNLCTASPAGDALPPLYVLGAEVELLSAAGERRLPLAAFIRGPGETVLRPGEILAAVRVPFPPPNLRHHYEKVGQRRALACSVASLAALIGLSPEGTVTEARLAWGSVAPTVWTSRAVEAWLVGRPLDEASLAEAARRVRQGVAPIDDHRATAGYRREVAGRLLLRLADLAAGPGGALAPSP